MPDGPAITIISHDLWVSRFGANPAVLGAAILMNGVSTEVVGVMPEGFEFPADTRAWLPLALDRSNEGGRASHGYSAIGRLAPGKTMADLDAETEVVKARWAAEFEHNEAHFVWAQDLRTEAVGDASQRLLLLMSAVALVLLIACANIANLLLARGERRQNEVAVRTALGAGRGRITRQLITESLVLAAAAATVGLGLAHLGTRALISLDPAASPRLEEVALDGNVLLFTLGVTLITALFFGVAPAYLAGRRTTSTIASSASRALGGRRSASVRRLLVTGEVALSLVVVILAGLVVRSYSALSTTDPGMDPNDLLTFSITLPGASYPDDDLIPAEFERMLDGIRAIPGVSGVTATTNLPFNGRPQWDFQLDDRPAREDGDLGWNAGLSHVASDYFETLGIPVLDGRPLTRQDGRGDPLVAVVSETMASRFWPGESVIGKRFGYEMEEGVPWMTIVGLVPDPVTSTVDAEPYPHVYVPESQAGISTYFVPPSLQVAVRTSIDVEEMVPSVRATVAEFDRDLPLYQLTTMEEAVAESFAGPRITTNLLGVFAAIALILAAVGIYGVISYSVAGRTREIGIRVALGAKRQQITGMIIAEGVRPVVAGIMVGLIGAWYATRLVEAMLFGIEATDPLTFSVLPVGFLAIGVLASWVPALRATSVAPGEALQES